MNTFRLRWTYFINNYEISRLDKWIWEIILPHQIFVPKYITSKKVSNFIKVRYWRNSLMPVSFNSQLADTELLVKPFNKKKSHLCVNPTMHQLSNLLKLTSYLRPFESSYPSVKCLIIKDRLNVRVWCRVCSFFVCYINK